MLPWNFEGSGSRLHVSSEPIGIAMQAGASPLNMGPKVEESGARRGNSMTFPLRLLLGSLAGFYYFVLPVYMWIKNLIWPKNLPGF